MPRILILDDDDNLRQMLKDVLTDHGHTVFDAPDGRLGLQVFEREHPDLVVTDVIMPEVEGHEVLLKLRKKVPLIAMSGGLRQSAEDLLHVASLLGAARVLQKPFGTAALIHAIDELLPQSVQDEAAVSSG